MAHSLEDFDDGIDREKVQLLVLVRIRCKEDALNALVIEYGGEYEAMHDSAADEPNVPRLPLALLQVVQLVNSMVVAPVHRFHVRVPRNGNRQSSGCIRDLCWRFD